MPEIPETLYNQFWSNVMPEDALTRLLSEEGLAALRESTQAFRQLGEAFGRFRQPIQEVMESLHPLGVSMEDAAEPELAYIDDETLMDGPTMLEQLAALKAARRHPECNTVVPAGIGV